MNAPLRRKIFLVSIGTAVLAAVVYGFLPKPVPVDAAAARRGPLRVMVEEEGRTRVQDRFVVSSPVPGFLRRIDLSVGDTVGRGQPVAQLEPLRAVVLDPRSRAEAEAAVAAAEASLNAAREKARAAAADADYARERETRMKQLAKNGYISQNDLDQALAEAKKADAVRLSSEAAIAASQADLARARTALGFSAADTAPAGGKRVVVRAPVSGRVLKLHRESEGVVNAGDPLIDIGDPGGLEVKVEVLSADAVKIGPGTPVLFERWGGDKPLEGKVETVEPAGFTKVSSLGVEEQRVNVIVGITSPREVWRGLGDGYRLDAGFVIWEGKDVLQVPASALFRKGEGWGLYVVERERAVLREVKVGHRNGLSAEVLSGVTEGTPVIIHPDDTVRDGVSIRMRK
jgi:HlyD family secretion protein